MMTSHADMALAGLSGRVLALSITDGTVKWEQQVEPGGEVSLLVWGDLVVASGGARLVGLHLVDGTRRFDVEVPGAYQQRPALQLKGSKLLVASAGEVACFELDGRQPRLLWHNRLAGRGMGAVSLG